MFFFFLLILLSLKNDIVNPTGLPLHRPLLDGQLKNTLKSFTRFMTLDVVPIYRPSGTVILLDKEVNLS